MAELGEENIPSFSFRPSKKRKLFRPRPSDNSDDESANTTPIPEQVEAKDNQDGPGTSSIVRPGRSKLRKGGIGAAPSASNSTTSTLSTALVPQQDDDTPADYTSQRFIAQTGLVKDDLDKHMIAYVDSKMAELRSESLKTAPSLETPHDNNAGLELGRPRQAATTGKLQEIDLGPKSTLQNIARTEQAARRLQDGTEPEPQEAGRRRRKPRIGPDGKPWRSRRPRRGSEDLKRDKLVEQLLGEHGLGLYDPNAETGNTGGTGDDEAADERLAEQFRQEFMDSQNVRRKAPPPPTKPGEEKTKGPKLGGSRSARAAMQKAMEEATKKK